MKCQDNGRVVKGFLNVLKKRKTQRNKEMNNGK